MIGQLIEQRGLIRSIPDRIEEKREELEVTICRKGDELSAKRDEIVLGLRARHQEVLRDKIAREQALSPPKLYLDAEGNATDVWDGCEA